MKAITLWQPYASALALKHKRYETRSWPKKYRGPLAIHAAARESAADAELFAQILLTLHQIDYEAWENHCEALYSFLPFGEIVATCVLEDCLRTEDVQASEVERLFGNFEPGRFAWKLSNIERLETPIPAKGRQGFWEWNPKPAVGAESQTKP